MSRYEKISEIVETIDSLPAHKFIILFGIVPALLFFTYINILAPLTEFTINSVVISITWLLFFSIICTGVACAAFAMGKAADYIGEKISQSYTKHMAQFIADVLTHDDKIRKIVVDGIVSGVHKGMLQDSPVVIDLKQRVEKLEQLLKKEIDAQNTSENTNPITQPNKFQSQNGQ